MTGTSRKSLWKAGVCGSPGESSIVRKVEREAFVDALRTGGATFHVFHKQLQQVLESGCAIVASAFPNSVTAFGTDSASSGER